MEYLYPLPDYATDSNDSNEDDDNDELEDTVSKIFSATAFKDHHDHNNNIDLDDIPGIEPKICPLTRQQSDIKRKQERSNERKK